jgi:hypothetical protein
MKHCWILPREGAMKVFTIDDSRVFRGATMDSSSVNKPAQERSLLIGGGKNCKDILMFKKNPAEIDNSGHLPYGGVMYDAHPVPTHRGYVLAKPHRESDKVLVVIKTRTPGMIGSPGKKGSGTWSFDSKTTSTSDAIEQTLVQATGAWCVYSDQDAEDNIGWRDALVVMKVGDAITIRYQNGDYVTVKYESVEAGLVVDTRVRMILQDYDAAPDGDGLCIKLDKVFLSRKAALHYKSQHLRDMYWGTIQTLDGVVLQSVEECYDRSY